MLRYLARRVAFSALISILIVVFFHLGMRMLPNSSVAEPNYDLVPLLDQAWKDTRAFLTLAMDGELGMASVSMARVEVTQVLRQAYVNSMGLLLVSLICAVVVGVLLGSVAALARWRLLVLPLLTLTILGVSAPSFLGALLLQIGEIKYYRTFGARLVLIAGFGWDFKHMLMPVLLLAARPLAYVTRATFIALKRIMEEDYIRTAYSKGLSTLGTVVIHALRNLIVPLLTAAGVSLRFSLSTLPVIELFFIWPGMGMRLLEAVNSRQTTLVVAIALAIGLTIVLTNLLLDVLFRFVDPRMREGGWSA